MTDQLSIQYLTNTDGQKTAVVIPIDQWLEYAEYLEQYMTIKQSIKKGLEEVAEIKAGKVIPQSVEDFLEMNLHSD
ncbi:MAG: hypothetical protein AAGI23_03245 [Bacteroidota bacterium]